MTVLTLIRCDHCGAEQELRGGVAADPAGWGVLHLEGGKRDLCPACTQGKASTVTRGSHLRAS